jgi:hypothetical protein
MHFEHLYEMRASSAVRSPVFTAVVMAAMAAVRSCGCWIAGSWKLTARPLRRGNSRSKLQAANLALESQRDHCVDKLLRLAIEQLFNQLDCFVPSAQWSAGIS